MRLNQTKHNPGITKLARQHGLSPSTVCSRVHRLGMSLDEALNTPLRRTVRRKKKPLALSVGLIPNNDSDYRWLG